jgi:hypothetical protein
MNRTRRLARTLLRLALPAALLAAAWMPAPAHATRERNCLYGFYYVYYDEFGNACGWDDTCSNSRGGDCLTFFSYTTYTDDQIVCYCDN